MQRYGMTILFDGPPLHAQREWFIELEELGYTDLWSSEANGADAFTPLALASVWVPSMRLGPAIVPAFTRGPACLAQSIGSLAQAAPGRLAFGIGTSSNVIVEGWNGILFDEPYKRRRDRQLAVGRRCQAGRADRARRGPGQGDRGPHLRGAQRRHGHGPSDGEV